MLRHDSYANLTCLYVPFHSWQKAWRSSITLAPLLSYSKWTLYHIRPGDLQKNINLRPLVIFGIFSNENSLQFHSSFWNCLSHSSFAILSAYKSKGTMSGWSRQMNCTWSRVSNIAIHSLALKGGGPASGSIKTVTWSSATENAAWLNTSTNNLHDLGNKVVPLEVTWWLHGTQTWVCTEITRWDP